jgi:prolyl-tRNA synthetase
MGKKDNKGITVKKEDFSEWYTQIIQKGDIADNSIVSGCLVYKPRCMAIWEKIKDVVDSRLKDMGVKNVYFPLLIPESLLNKEAKHVEGFSPEVAWVTHTGDSKLHERLAIRPTSETIMYDSYSKWIRSYNDLPMRLNQWNTVIRWEFKHPTPFLRSREFLWNEGHTCFSNRKDAEKEIKDIIKMYDTVLREYLALPSLIGKKSEKETFAGAEYTVSTEQFMPNGKSIQGPDVHFDGQNFAKAFDIKFTDEDGSTQYVWQNTFAISSRMLGVLFAIHGDDKGLVLPPKLAPEQVVIIPILFDDSRNEVVKESLKVFEKLKSKGISVYLDDRSNYSPGWKFNEWEVKGVPIRIEIGPKDIEKNRVTVVRRDTGEKFSVKSNTIEREVPILLDKIQNDLLKNAEKNLKSSIVKAETSVTAKKAIDSCKIVFVKWCSTSKCEEDFKEKTGAKSLNGPLIQPKIDGKCFACSKKATVWFYFGKSY